MITKQDIQQIHKSANVEQIKHSQLFTVEYPGLTLLLSYKTLIGFKAINKWHLSTASRNISKQTLKHYYHALDLFHIDVFHTSMKNLKDEFRRAINTTKL